MKAAQGDELAWSFVQHQDSIAITKMLSLLAYTPDD